MIRLHRKESAVPNLYTLFPEELKKLERWCVYKLVWNGEKKKFDKPPYNARTHRKGNPIIQDDRSSFDVVCEAISTPDYEYDGAGFGLDYADGLTCLDFDNCVKSDVIDPAIQEIVTETNSYAEFSPTGKGVHVWVRGWQVPIVDGKEGCKVGQAEIYSGKHYLTVTGKHVPGTPLTVEARDLSNLHKRIVAGEFKTEALPPSVKEAVEPRERVQIVTEGSVFTNKLELLMHGSIIPGSKPFVISAEGAATEYLSQSEADQALCSLLAASGLDAEKIDQEFRKSSLYRAKWERKDYREATINRALKPNAPVVYTEAIGDVPEPPDENSEAAIPPFDASVINGVYSKVVELVCRGTTLAPQYAYVLAKTIIGARMASKVKFENLDVEPRYYTALIGETGSGKGEAWRRIFKILRPEGATITCGLKVINSADSGAGLKDVFFEIPEHEPVVCYVDEIQSLGNKAKDTRNPGILDAMIELADSTSVSRVLAKSKGGSKTKHDARLSMVMCGQDGLTYTKALAGQTKVGLWDRLYPEFGVPQETGDLPPVNVMDAVRLLSELNSLDYSGAMDMSTLAKAQLDEFWNSQAGEVRKKARWKKNLILDAYMSAFGRRSRTVEPEDVAIAVKIFTRQLVIRRVCFTTEVPDRTGYYIGLIKRIVSQMERRLAAGVAPELVAKSRRDFETETHAFRDNETHIFARAWQVHSAVYLSPITIKKANGQTYMKYVPSEE